MRLDHFQGLVSNMSNINQSIANAAIGHQNVALGAFINYSCKGKRVFMNFENNQVSLAQTYSNELAQNLVDIFNGKKTIIELENDEFAEQRTGKYKPYLMTCVIEEAKRPSELMGELSILMITSNIEHANAYLVCEIIAELLSS